MFYRHDLLRAAAGQQRKFYKDIAAETGLSRHTVGRVMDGDANAAFLTIFKVAQALGFADMSALMVAERPQDGTAGLESQLPRERIA